jgi:hypothetical protein
VAAQSQEGTGMKRSVLLVALVLWFAAGHRVAEDVTYNLDQDTDFSRSRAING